MYDKQFAVTVHINTTHSTQYVINGIQANYENNQQIYNNGQQKHTMKNMGLYDI
jgi:hypothetical protein